MIAALYIDAGGVYDGLPGVDAWDIVRDARLYDGPHPVVAHPPCQRWGRFHHGSTRKPHQFRLGDDDGCFAHALLALADHGGVIESTRATARRGAGSDCALQSGMPDGSARLVL